MTTDQYKKALKLADKLALASERVRSCFARVLSDRIYDMSIALDEYNIFIFNLGNEKQNEIAENPMHWLPIDPDNLPEGEVLAGNFDKDSGYYKDKMIGKVRRVEDNMVRCKDRIGYMMFCTHYIDINKFDL